MTAQKTPIQWTDSTWNPARGCSRVSPGCENCYAERVAAHPWMSLPGKPYHGLAIVGPNGPRWTRVVRFVPEAVVEPLSWRKPRRVFVNSMSDLFHESLTNEQIAAVHAVMGATRRHTYQVLTKRAGRMFEWHQWAADRIRKGGGLEALAVIAEKEIGPDWLFVAATLRRGAWPLPNLHLCVSVEDQPRALDRVPLLLAVPAVVRGVSYEPALGHVDWRDWLNPFRLHACNGEGGETDTCAGCHEGARAPVLDWIIVGGESGPGARPFDTRWAVSTIAACARAGVACFVKQMGSRPLSLKGAPVKLKDPKGGDMSEWPQHLRVRQWPGQEVST
jgi:protein gp37